MIEVSAEVPRLNLPAEFHLGGGNQLDIHGMFDHCPYPPHPFGFDGGKALALERKRQGGDLI